MLNPLTRPAAWEQHHAQQCGTVKHGKRGARSGQKQKHDTCNNTPPTHTHTTTTTTPSCSHAVIHTYTALHSFIATLLPPSSHACTL